MATEKTAEKQTKDLKTFIENVNKKDKRNGRRIRFGWVRGTRK